MRQHILMTCFVLVSLASPSHAQRCDVNGDGNTTASDALTVLNHAVGISQSVCDEPLPTCSTTTTTTTLPLPGERHFERPASSFTGSAIVVFDAFADSMVVQITVESGNVFFCNDPLLILQDDIVYLIEDLFPNSSEIGLTWVNHDGCGSILSGVIATGTMAPPYPAGFDITQPFRIFMGIWEDDDFFDVGAL